jgi:hypothetical protein
MSGLLWIALIVIAAILVFGIRAFGRRRAFRGRTAVELAEMHHPHSSKVSFETFEQVLRAVGDAYSLDPRLLRPEDQLSKLLNMDSWVLDAGTEKLNKWLRAAGVATAETRVSTVLDLVLLVEASKS